MAIEFETKILEINQKEIENKLKELWAEYKWDILLKRWVYDMESEDTEFVRLRDEWDKITLTYKHRTSKEVWNTQELEVIVNDFDETAQILSKLDWKDKLYQENRKITYVLNNISFEINIWPMIPTFMEIESDSIEKVNEWLELLWLKWKEIGDVWQKKLYEQHYWININAYKELKFNN